MRNDRYECERAQRVVGFVSLLERLTVAAAILVVSVAIAVGALTVPAYTRTMAARLDVASASGLSEKDATAAAESVRRFVTQRNAPALSAEVAGRAGFDSAAVSHLADVRDVLLGFRSAAIALALGLALWLVVSLARRRLRIVGRALKLGGLACLLAPVVLGLAGALDFDLFFQLFHGVFFQAGTWTFPWDSLLILLFPEAFWMTSGVLLGVLVMAQGLALWLAGHAFEARSEGPALEPEHTHA